MEDPVPSRRLISRLQTTALAVIAAAGAAYFWAVSSYNEADEGHLFEGDGREHIDRADWFYSNWVGGFIILVVFFIPLALLLRIAYVAWRNPEKPGE
jgi:hypothetical protein